eukprot:2021158-Lingulodinium_polyedra.AAC.1
MERRSSIRQSRFGGTDGGVARPRGRRCFPLCCARVGASFSIGRARALDRGIRRYGAGLSTG